MTQADTTYLVALGEMIFRVQEECPKSALAAVKAKILCDNTRPSLSSNCRAARPIYWSWTKTVSSFLLERWPVLIRPSPQPS